MLVVLDGPAVRRWCGVGSEALDCARAEIDALNVFPVPDGDTGTNLALTMRAVVDALAHVDGDLSTTMRTVARAALTGARGNSGVILSEMLRGLADALHDRPAATGADLQRALTRAADAAYAAVAEPVEGTLLTVARAAASGASAADAADLAAVVAAASRAAAEALDRTPLQLAVLAAAGVVDAGGRGLVVLLEALTAVVTGQPYADRPSVRARDPNALVVARETGSPQFCYEVQYLLDAPDSVIPGLRDRLARLGDSVVVVGGDGLHNVHVHVNDIGAAIEAGVGVGHAHRITVTRFADQTAAAPSVVAGRVVAVTSAPGLTRLFEAAGAIPVEAPVGASPSTADILGAITASASDCVAVLPNARDLHAVANAAARLAREEGRNVTVLPTRSAVQGLAALAVHDAERRFDDDVVAMSAAAAATRHAEVTTAVRDAQTSAGACRAGDVLGLIDGDVVVIGVDVAAVARGLLDRMLIGGGELVTLVSGSDAPQSLTDSLVDYLCATRPAVETVVYAGEQPHYPLLVGVE